MNLNLLCHVVAFFGDMEMIVPASIMLTCLLWLLQRRREAGAWLIAFWLCAAIIYLAKQIGPFRFHVGDQEIKAISMPSGHAGMSMIFYGQLAVLMWYDLRSWWRALVALPMAAIGLIDLAIYHLWWHSLFDIFTGIALGISFLVALRFYDRIVVPSREAEGPRDGSARAAHGGWHA